MKQQPKTRTVPAYAIFDRMMPGCGPWMMYSEHNPGAKMADYELVKDERLKKYNDLVAETSKKNNN